MLDPICELVGHQVSKRLHWTGNYKTNGQWWSINERRCKRCRQAIDRRKILGRFTNATQEQISDAMEESDEKSRRLGEDHFEHI